MAKLLVIIPAYNEEEAIRDTIRALTEAVPDADYLVINDCSKDGTRAILRSGGLSHVDLPINLGIGGGVQTGYLYACEHGYDIAVQFDGDGQHRADYIAPLIEPILKDEADMVVGSRFIPGHDEEGFRSSRMRRTGIRILRALIRLCSGQTVYDVTSGFRAVNRELIAFFADNYAQDYPEPEAVITALSFGYRVKEVPVLMNPRQGGQSSIRAFRSVYYMIKVSLAVLLAGIRTGKNKKGGRRA